MSRWTDSARTKLEEYFARNRQSLAACGADADEVTDDLRRHIEQEIAARQLTVVTEQDLQQILARIGAPEAGVALADPPAAKSAACPSTDARSTKPPGWWLLVLGVILPLAAIVFEFASGACAGLFFDPLPTLAHAALATFVPVTNLLVWLAVRRGETRRRAVLAWANGAAIGIGLVFSILFLPLTPYAVASIALIMGVLFYGIGLAPLTPLFAFIAALQLRRHLRLTTGENARLPGLWPGFAIGVGLLMLVTLPRLFTVVGLDMATSENAATSARGVRLLRLGGDDEELLRACYGRAGRSGEIFSWGSRMSPEAARLVYYRVHGAPFNAVPPPRLYAGRARWEVMEQEFTWDNDQAGDAVAGRVRGLSLVHSRQDAVIEPEAALGYVEWTLEFKNDSSLARESRAQILLPPGGVVSRLTLWIDGEEREAAFGGRSQVKAAYQEVVRQRRDPVMVSTCGPDRVLMQCYPVPANGGKMKVRLGMTAPLALIAADKGLFRLPSFAERNFTEKESFRHSVWVESPLPLEGGAKGLKNEPGRAGSSVLRGEFTEEELTSPASALRVRRPAEVTQSWTRDTRQENAPFIRQTIAQSPASVPERVILVVDGTKGMETFYRGICAALTKLPPNIDFALLLARDGCEDFIPLQKGTPDLYARVALWKARSAGGHDNIPALVRAWDLAAATEASAIVWVHGPQPITMESTEDLRQRFERSVSPPLLFDVEARRGPNRILEALGGFKSVRILFRAGDLGDDLGRLFGAWSGHAPAFDLKRESVPAETGAAPPAGKEASLHLARLWAAGETDRLAGTRHLDQAAHVATSHQLVTPVSGAVVLETKTQYQRAGLEPVPPESVPVVPEPSSLALLALALLALGAKVLRQQVRR